MRRSYRPPSRGSRGVRAFTRGLVAALAVGIACAQLASAPPPRTDLSEIRAQIDDGWYARAETAARAAIGEIERTPADRSELLADAVLLLAESLRFSDRVLGDETLGAAERAVELAKALPGDDRERVAASLLNLGHLRYMRDEYAEARVALEASLAADTDESATPRARAGITLTLLAHLAFDQSHSRAEADVLFERARDVQEATLAPNHPDVAFRHLFQGNVASGVADYELARAEYDRAIEIWREVLRPGHPLTARALSNLGNALQNLGEYVAARKCLREALAMRIEAYGPEHRHVASTLNILARLEFWLNDLAEARAHWQRAFEIESASGGARSLKSSVYLRGIGDCLTREARWSEAADAYERALAILEARHGHDAPETSDVLLMLANVRLAAGDFEATAQLLERAERIQAAGDPDTHSRAMLTAIWSDLDRKANRAERARERLTEALEFVSTRVEDDSQLVPYLLNSLAETDVALGDFDAALEHLLRAESIQREQQRESGRMLDESGSLAFGGVRNQSLNDALHLALKTTEPKLRARAWDALVRSRGLVFEEIAARSRIARESRDPKVAGAARALADARAELARLTVHGPEGVAIDEFRARMAAVRASKKAAEEELGELVGARNERDVGIDSLVGSLPAQCALVSYVRCSPASAEPFYVAFAIGPARGVPVAKRLGGALEIEQLVSRTLAAARNPLDLETYLSTASELRTRIWDPLADELRGAREIFVVPDGAVSVVNFAALPAGGATYLAEGSALIRVLCTERDLAPVDAPPAGRGLLALGGPSFDARAPLVAQSDVVPGSELPRPRASSVELPSKYADLSFRALPGSIAEIRAIRKLWLATVSGRDASRDPEDEVLTLDHKQATEANFKRNAPGRRVLHLATHGFFVPSELASRVERSRGVFAASVRPALAHPLPLETSEDPLLLSGLALAGANHRGDAHDSADDGILTAEEIASLDLSSVECAVLSACDTGLGEIASGEGIYGLRRAFQLAGVRSLVVSLWPVDDETTQSWMSELYRSEFVGGADVAAAVRDASLATLAARRAEDKNVHPYYWCAFVAIGSIGAPRPEATDADSTRIPATGRR